MDTCQDCIVCKATEKMGLAVIPRYPMYRRIVACLVLIFAVVVAFIVIITYLGFNDTQQFETNGNNSFLIFIILCALVPFLLPLLFVVVLFQILVDFLVIIIPLTSFFVVLRTVYVMFSNREVYRCQECGATVEITGIKKSGALVFWKDLITKK